MYAPPKSNTGFGNAPPGGASVDVGRTLTLATYAYYNVMYM